MAVAVAVAVAVAGAMASILAVRHVMTLRGVDAKTARRVELLVTAGVEPGSPNRSRLGGHDCMAAFADGVAKEKESRVMACRGWADEALVVREKVPRPEVAGEFRFPR